MLSLTYEGWILAGAPKHEFNYNFFFPSPVFVYSDARGWLWLSALLCHHVAPSSSFLCWPTSPWQPLWMLECCPLVGNQSDVIMLYTRELENMHTSQQFRVSFSSKRGRGQGWWVPCSAVQERGREGRPSADEVVRVVSLLQTSALLALQRLRSLRGG